MNGVRKLFSSSTASSPDPPASPPPVPLGKPSWPPQGSTPPDSPLESSPKSSSALLLRRERQKGSISSISSQPVTGSSSPRVLPRKSVPVDLYRSASTINTRDELLISLLASEAVVDSRGCDVLSAEDVEDLKKEQQVLNARLAATSKKLALETKIRDAAISLSKVNASHKTVSKQTEAQLDAANNRVDVAQKEFWRVSERANDVHKRLLEHRAAVLSLSVRSLEKKLSADDHDSGYTTPSNSQSLHSPTTSVFSSSSSKARFEGAHFFAGHAEAIVPKHRVASTEISSLEQQLKATTDALNAASKKQAETQRELTMLQLEKQEVETMMSMELQSAEDTINALEREIPRFEEQDIELRALAEEKELWLREREQMQKQLKEASAIQQGQSDDVVAGLRRELQEKDSQVQHALKSLEQERAEWEHVRAELEDEKLEDLARLQEEAERLQQQDSSAIERLKSEIDGAIDTLRSFMEDRGIPLSSMDTSLKGLLLSLSKHVDGLDDKVNAFSKSQAEWESIKRKLEDNVRSGLDKRESLARDLELARQEREDLRKTGRTLEERLRRQSGQSAIQSRSSGSFTNDGSNSDIIAILRPIWAILPSPEARASKLGASASSSRIRTNSPTHASSPTVSSLAELDVRSLKSLYDATKMSSASPDMASFTIEAFASRVQALVADDRALIERLVRFAQAHELLKRNAERAQKIAQESNNALETYQKQVRALEDRNMGLSAMQAALQEQIQELEVQIDNITAQKLDIEMQAAEQAETCRQLTEANNALSARTLNLAQEAASAPEMVKKQLDSQLAECRTALKRAEGELDAMRNSEQSQRIALLDELNTMQTENGQLRARLRASGK